MKRTLTMALATTLLANLAFFEHALASMPGLAQHPTWLKLGYYEEMGSSASGYLSAATSAGFFLAENGREDPASELEATIAALSKPVDGDINEHAQCRFPGRDYWLRAQSALPGVARLSCPDFEAWVFGEATDSLSIVFATGYLGNPASYYGHTLLKFNSSSARETSDLLDVTVNYGAIIPDGTGPINYLYNGATGGFSAGFSHIEYYFHDYNYGELELRDLWEYELNLSEDEVRFVVAHAWEVLGREFVYYFFRRNCAYRMAEVIQIIDGIELIPPRRPWTVPQALIRSAAQSQHSDGPLIRNVTYYPSRQSAFYQKYRNLDRAERRVLRELARKPESALPLLAAMPVGSRQSINDTLIDYYQYLMPRDEPPDSDRSRRYRATLARRFGLPPAERTITQAPARGPDSDRAPGYLSTGFAHNDRAGNGATLRVRAAYYDALDASVSHVPNSELTMGDVIVSSVGDGLSLRRASLFRVESVNGATSGLPGDNGHSWRLGLGLTEQSPGCDDCLVTRFDADIGRSVPVGDFSVAGAYVGGAVQDNRNDNGNLLVRASAYWNLNLSDRLRMRARYESRYHIDSRLKMEDVFSVGTRLAISRSYDVRLTATKNVTTEVALTFGYYW